jgi:hypothetical protein
MRSPLFKFFASLKLAVVSILLLAGVLAAATLFESNYGMRAVHLQIYGTPWFAGVLVLLGSNVLCAALSRYPWKKHQTGFVITHSGILILLFGSFLTQKFGVDANLPVVEGSREDRAILNDLSLVVSDENNRDSAAYPFPEFARREKKDLLKVEISPGKFLIADEFLPRVVQSREMKESPIPGVGDPAVNLRLFNDRFEVMEWLSTHHPHKAAELNLGPAVVSLKKLWTKAEEAEFLKPAKNVLSKPSVGQLAVQQAGKEFRVPIELAMKKWYSLSGTGIEINVTRYLPYAVVDKNDLTSRSNEPVNPAVQISVRKGDVTEKHTVFANFPEFSTLHGAKRKKEHLGVTIRMIAANPEGGRKGQGKLFFAQSADNERLLYRVLGKDGTVNSQGVVTPGKAQATGWMDLQFEIAKWIPFSVEDFTPKYIDLISGSDNFLSAAHFRVEGGGKPQDFWLYEGTGKTFAIEGKGVSVEFKKKTLSIPFLIHLDKFTMGTDPGTTKAATYESNVRVFEDGKEKRHSLISMNEPLQHGGYTLYQASYQMEEGRAPTSIFAVNYDPGRWVKYLGCLFIVIGAITMFWMNPHYWAKIFGGKRI